MASFLSKIKKGVVLPPRVALIGQIKIGKSTYASKAPKPLFIAAEDGHEIWIPKTERKVSPTYEAK